MKRLPSQTDRTRSGSAGLAALAALAALACGCSGTPIPGALGGRSAAEQLAEQRELAQTLGGARISFHYSDYYGLTNPNAEQCAGDIMTLYDPVGFRDPSQSQTLAYFGISNSSANAGIPTTGPTGPLRLPADVSYQEQTIRPAFIKNVSVDMTDANAPMSQNRASSCSLGNGAGVPATSNCATFDFGTIGGIPSNLGGTLLVIGGIQSYNYSGRLPSTFDPSFPPAGMSVACGSVVNLGHSSLDPATAPRGYTECASSIYALGVNTLPQSTFESNPSLIPAFIAGEQGPTGPISMWANLSGEQGYTGPAGSAGASVSYDPGLQQILFFAGAAPLSALGSDAPGVTTYDTWIYDLKAQRWQNVQANVYVDNFITTLYDTFYNIVTPLANPTAGIDPTPVQIPKSSGARSVFGYVPTVGTGLKPNALNATGAMSASLVDETDRLLIVGGYNSTGVLTGTHRFNPTYGPEVQDTQGTVGTNTASVTGLVAGIADTSTTAEIFPVQWIDSYHTQMMSSTYGSAFFSRSTLPTPAVTTEIFPYTDRSSRFAPDLPPLSVGPTGGESVINAAFTSISRNSSGAADVTTGYLLGTGGFDASSTSNRPETTPGYHASFAGCTYTGVDIASDSAEPYGANTDLRCGGGLSLFTRFFRGTAGTTGDDNEGTLGVWDAIPNTQDVENKPASPGLWTQYRESADGADANRRYLELLGGQTMLPGFNLQNNDVVIFGGLDCRTYVSDTSAPCNTHINGGTTSQGRYFSFGQTPANAFAQPAAGGAPTVPNDLVPALPPANTTWVRSTAQTATLPFAAGMAAARGEDPSGSILILAWGGAIAGARTDSYGKIYYLVESAAGDYRWGYASPANSTVRGDVPAELINAAMVYSHVTGKYYVFGGYDPNSQATRGETYELSISSPSSLTCAPLAGTGNCIFTWRKLSQSTGVGLTCYPGQCPQARRSHRIAEVNYFNRNPGGRLGGVGSYTTSGQQPCDSNAPCSYGIFMEGGTPDGVNFLSDRWMFDPTANGGNGHWQLMTELPPRALAAMTAVDYTLPTNGQSIHRAILFGGETGLHNPQWSSNRLQDRFFVAPTLGDTWMFDYDTHAWNRVRLLGKGYQAGTLLDGNGNQNLIPNSSNDFNAGTEFRHREAFNAQQPNKYPGTASDTLGSAYNELSPPPLAGAVMVSRTLAPPPTGATGPTMPLRSLPIPEVYLFGGRKKDGGFSTLTNVYKFCAGTTGETFTLSPPSGPLLSSLPSTTDYSCDGFDPTYNPASPSPVTDYVGRWLTKKPAALTTAGTAIATDALASYLGAGAYDSTRDRIVLYGGLTSLGDMGTQDATAVTHTGQVYAGTQVYEYTPPQPQGGIGREGQWTYVPSCPGFDAPEGRYGHSMAYNPLGRNVIIMGGYRADGTPLTFPINDYSSQTTYDTPQVWTGTFCETPDCGGKLPSSDIVLTGYPCYFWQPITTFGNSTAIQSQVPPQTGLAHSASVFIPSTGYNLGYYAMFDRSCSSQGPIASPDSSLNKLLAGGVYIDIDRAQLGENENLLLNITYMPLGVSNTNPDNTRLSLDQSAVFRVHLVRTGQTQQQLQAIAQPRYMSYSDTQQYPEIVRTLSVMAPPTGQMTTEQVLLPISVDPKIDRIRIERYSGSGILLDASIFKMGTK